MHKTETIKVDKEISPMKVYGIESIGYPMDTELKEILKMYYRRQDVHNIDYQRYHEQLFAKDFVIKNDINAEYMITKYRAHSHSYLAYHSSLASQVQRDKLTSKDTYCEGGKRYIHYKKTNNKGEEVEIKQKLVDFNKAIDPHNALTLKDIGSYSDKLYCTIGNSFEHKINFHKLQQSKFDTCQTSSAGDIESNNAGYGSGFTSGYCLPLLIYADEEHTAIVGRIMCRLVFDSDGKPYIFIARLYYARGGRVSSQIYGPLIKALLDSGYRVIASSGKVDIPSLKTQGLKIEDTRRVFKSGPFMQVDSDGGQKSYYTEYGINSEGLIQSRAVDIAISAYIFSL